MKVTTPARFFLSLVAFVLLTVPAAVVRAQDARSALANFPESQAVLYINARRLINEAAPTVVPPEVLNKALADAKQFVDLNGLEYVIAGARLKGDMSVKEIPEFLLIVRGNFSADALLSGARMMGKEMYTQETVGTKTINVFTFNKPAPADGGNNSGKGKFPIDQIAAVALDANTIAVGIPAYLRDAIEEGGARPRLKPELVDLAMRDANTLVSLVADIPPGMSKHIRALGAPPNAEMESMVDALRQVQLAVTMQPSTFGLQSIMRMDSSEKAMTLSGLVNMGLGFAKGELTKELQKSSVSDREDKAALLRVLETFTNASRGSEVELGLTFQQASLAEVVKRQMTPKPKKQETAVAAPGAKKGAAVKRRRARPRRK
ncbi:MAG: hypothetical protein QOD32_1937 [Pyrinomonadaceae bacterium]|jgi:hypothetical protein|nr:hypothetical protein [Pyrinomonadaceae bacterium]